LGKLTSLKFFDASVDGCSPEALKSVLAAFQKYNKLDVDGLYTAELAKAIMQAQPATAEPGSEATRIVVELERQLLFLYKDGQLTRIQHVSTGRPSLPTPTGRFEILEYYPGLPPGEDSDYPMYLYQYRQRAGNVAIHGYPDVPFDRSASHGCVRLPLGVNRSLYNIVSAMDSPMPVYIV
jgi:lipoprotein-anchoring transpeptidase ErfK/SrfK